VTKTYTFLELNFEAIFKLVLEKGLFGLAPLQFLQILKTLLLFIYSEPCHHIPEICHFVRIGCHWAHYLQGIVLETGRTCALYVCKFAACQLHWFLIVLLETGQYVCIATPTLDLVQCRIFAGCHMHLI
jgi:hypothetical protein